MQICRDQGFNSKQTAASPGDVHTNWRVWMLVKLGILGFQVFAQTPLRVRSHLWNPQLDVCPDFCACKTEAWGLSDDSDTTALFIHFRILPGKHRKSCMTEWECERQHLPEIQTSSWSAAGVLWSQVFVLPPSIPDSQSGMCCLLFTSEELQWPIRSWSTSHSQCRIVLYICFKNASKHSLHPNVSTGVSWSWWGNSNKRVGQCKAIPASAGQKSSSHCSELSQEN